MIGKFLTNSAVKPTHKAITRNKCVQKVEEKMDLDSVKRYLEKGDEENPSAIAGLPFKFFEKLVLQGLHLDLIEPGRLVFSMKVPPRLVNDDNSLHAGATTMLVDAVGSAVMVTVGQILTGVSVDINFSCMDAAYADEEIEIEGRVLHVGKTVGVTTVEFRKKKTGKIIAHGRHAKYLAVSSKL